MWPVTTTTRFLSAVYKSTATRPTYMLLQLISEQSARRSVQRSQSRMIYADYYRVPHNTGPRENCDVSTSVADISMKFSKFNYKK